jgi:signal transduction histidine kinase
MMPLILSVVAVLLVDVILLQLFFLKRCRQTIQSLKKGFSKERNATVDIMRLSKDVITFRDKEKDFLPNFIKYAVQAVKANGGALLLCGEDNYFYGCAVSGIMPPMKDVAEQMESQLLANDKHHTEFMRGLKIGFTAAELEKLCGEAGFAYFSGKNPPGFPDRFCKTALRCLIAPIRFRKEIYGCVIIASSADSTHQLVENDGFFILRLAEIASLSIEFIKDYKKRQEDEQLLQQAREEGMVQVSSGIIHNIGNAITIDKLAICSLQENMNISGENRPESLILSEILPKMTAALKDGKLQEFMSQDKIGKQYLEILTKLVEELRVNACESGKLLESLNSKLSHISDIIELQQHFVGELGTENMTQLATIVEAAAKIFEESFNKRGVIIKRNLKSNLPEILVDSSIMTQVFINIIKNAIEAIEIENMPNKNYVMQISVDCEERNGKKYVWAEIKDNGPGIPEEVKAKMFDFGFTTRTQDNPPSRGIGLHFSLDAVNKYGGMIDFTSNPGEGATFKVLLPAGKNGHT